MSDHEELRQFMRRAQRVYLEAKNDNLSLATIHILVNRWWLFVEKKPFRPNFDGLESDPAAQLFLLIACPSSNKMEQPAA